ncbi:MAG: chlorophyll synthesis pathway protein BchC [Pseudomonadota bacterium]
MEMDSLSTLETGRQRAGQAAAAPEMRARAVVFKGDGETHLQTLDLTRPQAGEVVVDVAWSGISTGTERMLWSGEMPPFPGMGYPLVPGYESVGRIVWAPDQPQLEGQMAFVPGASCYENASGLFGASASRLVVKSERLAMLGEGARPEHTLLALAATAHHAVSRAQAPDLVVGNGVLGRLIARITEAVTGQRPAIWETDPTRRTGTDAIDPAKDTRTDYHAPCDVSGSAEALDQIIARSAKGAQVVLAGFYKDRPSFAFPPAFMKEVSLHVAAEWRPENLTAAVSMVRDGALSLDGLITHTTTPKDVPSAYATAFEDSACLKMIIDWDPAK